MKYDKPAEFIGKAAALAEKENGVKRKLTTFVVETDTADVHADEPIWHEDNLVGFVTSGGYAHWAGKSVAIGFLPPELIVEGIQVEIEILGEKCPATVFTQPLFDPESSRMRS